MSDSPDTSSKRPPPHSPLEEEKKEKEEQPMNVPTPANENATAQRNDEVAESRVPAPANGSPSSSPSSVAAVIAAAAASLMRSPASAITNTNTNTTFSSTGEGTTTTTATPTSTRAGDEGTEYMSSPVNNDSLSNTISPTVVKKVKQFIHNLRSADAGRASPEMDSGSIPTWRDDDAAVTAISSFFDGSEPLECIDNRVVDAMVERGSTVQSDKELRTLLRNTPHLQLVSDKELDVLVRAVLRREYSPGETIVAEKHEFPYLGIVLFGHLDIFRVIDDNSDLEKSLSSKFKVAPHVQHTAITQGHLRRSPSTTASNTTGFNNSLTASQLRTAAASEYGSPGSTGETPFSTFRHSNPSPSRQTESNFSTHMMANGKVVVTMAAPSKANNDGMTTPHSGAHTNARDPRGALAGGKQQAASEVKLQRYMSGNPGDMPRETSDPYSSPLFDPNASIVLPGRVHFSDKETRPCGLKGWSRVAIPKSGDADEETHSSSTREHSSSTSMRCVKTKEVTADMTVSGSRIADAARLAAAEEEDLEAEELLKERLVHAGSMSAGDVFSLEMVIFEEPSKHRYCAGQSGKTMVALVPMKVIHDLMKRNVHVAQSIGRKIKESVDVFNPVRDFCRCVFSPVMAHNEYLALWTILESYTRLNNCIHTKLFGGELDTGAWGYALKRLPENVTSTFCFDLVFALPPFVATRMRDLAKLADVSTQQQQQSNLPSRATDIKFVRTRERRRCTWQLGMEGKTLVLLRDGYTDVLDFLTMLCIHIIESNKLRGRVQGMVHPPAIDILDDYLQQRDAEATKGIKLSDADERARTEQVLSMMPLSVAEREGLMRNWPQNCLLKIYEVMMHREEFNIRVDPSVGRRFQVNPFHEWALILRSTVLTKLGLPPNSPLPEDLVVDVISSNTHCLKNLLCSFVRTYRDEIRAYVVAKRPDLGKPEEWHTEEDMLYIASSDFMSKERPELKAEYLRNLEESGITVMEDTAMTGLQVDIIPVHLLNFETIDPVLQKSIRRNINKRSFRAVTWGERQKVEGEEFRMRQASSVYDETHHGSPPPVPILQTSGSSSLGGGRAGKTAHFQGVEPWTPTPGEPEVVVAAEEDTGDSTSMSVDDDDDDDNEGEARGSSRSGAHKAKKASGRATPYKTRGNETHHEDPHATRKSHRPRQGRRLARHFIINMDFAFGAQAEGICRTIFQTFGSRIRSINVMGKAGGLVGKRGDIQLATHVLHCNSSALTEGSDELRICRNQDFTAERLRELAGPRVDVHEGKVLTVAGTILQNERILRCYRRLWNCVGAEMEGSYFARVIEEFLRQGIARKDLVTRFSYYTSDMPLAMSELKKELVERSRERRTTASIPDLLPSSSSAGRRSQSGSKKPKRHSAEKSTAGGAGKAVTLSAPMTPQEGVPPLYAIARGILERALISANTNDNANSNSNMSRQLSTY